jgi:hypothetical protein
LDVVWRYDLYSDWNDWNRMDIEDKLINEIFVKIDDRSV